MYAVYECGLVKIPKVCLVALSEEAVGCVVVISGWADHHTLSEIEVLHVGSRVHDC